MTGGYNRRYMDDIDVRKYRDRGLIAFGIVQLVLGAICGLMAPLALLGAVMARFSSQAVASGLTLSSALMATVFYLLLASWFITMGIGSIMTKRWARALILVFSWLWLACGVLGGVQATTVLPAVYRTMARQGKLPASMIPFAMIFAIGFMVIVYVVIPGALILFYGRRRVKETCELLDPKVRWTDKCPLPVLAASFLYGLGAFGMLFSLGYGPMFPLFGTLLTGVPAMLAVGALAVLFAAVGVGVYRLRTEAWWGGMAVTVLGGLSAVVTFSRVSMTQLYENLNLPEQQMEMLRQGGAPSQTSTVVYTAVSVVGFAVFMLYVKRYFVPGSPAEAESAAL